MPQQSLDDIAELFRQVGLGNERAVEEMLRYRPELSRARDALSLSILQFARYMRQDAILERLVEAGPQLDVFEAASIDRADTVRDLVARDSALATAYSPDGATALHGAAYFGCASAIAELLEAGANIEARSRDGFEQTPLHAAAAGGRVEACRVLLRAGADPNGRMRGGLTPLMVAGAAGDRAIVEALVARNANFEVRDGDGRTAADIAGLAGHIELAARLRLGERVVDRGMA